MGLLKFAVVIFATLTVATVADLEFPLQSTANSPKTTPIQELDDSFRLPKDTIPTHYTIRLRTAVHDAERDFQGSVDIHLEVKQPTDRITVHSRSLTVTSAVLYTSSGDPWTEVDRPSNTYDEQREHLTFHCNTPLGIGISYVLRITYNGRLQTEFTAGFFRKYYRNNDGIRRYIAATQFQPTWARQAFPCFDEPAIRTTFTVSLIHHQSYQAISNMPREGPLVVDSLDPDYYVSTFAESQKMSTNGLAFAVTDFETKSWGAQLQILTRPNAINDTEYALSAGYEILLQFNVHLDLSFWNYMPQIVQIAIPDAGSGASETWGLVAYGEATLLYDPEVNDYLTKPAIARTIAHAHAHQWFGNLVTIDWWKHLWLHEGIATMYGYYEAHRAYPEDQHMDRFQLDVVQPALEYDASESTRPLNWNAESPAGIAGLFDTIARHKAACVTGMLRTILGEEYWRSGVKKYLRNHELDSATPDHLYEALEESIGWLPPFDIDGMTVKQFMDNWANASGYPVVNVRRIYGTKKVIIAQERFLHDRELPSDHVWYIPYYPRHLPALDHTYYSWLTKKAKEHNFDKYDNDTPFILNKTPVGFYRVNYDLRNWDLITKAWINSPNFISPNARAQLIDDAFALARAELLDFGVVLRLLTGLKTDHDYLPWATADKVLTYVHDRLRGTEQWNPFVFYVLTLTESNYRRVQLGGTGPNETVNDKHLKELILSWTCKLDILGCTAQVELLFRTAVRKDAGVHPDISSTVYCYGVRSAVDEEFVWLYRQMFDSRNEAERSTLINAMGCSQNKGQLDAYLTSSIGAGVGSEVNYYDRERLQVVQAVYSASRSGVDALIDFLNNWDIADDFIYWLEQPAFDDAIANIAARTNTLTEFDRLKDLLKTVGSLAPEDVVTAAMATVKANFDWYHSLEGLVIAEFLERYVFDSMLPQEKVKYEVLLNDARDS